MALRLRALGASLQGIRQAIQHIQEHHNKADVRTLHGRYLVWNGSDILEKTSDGVIAMLKRPQQHVFDWVISLDSVQEDPPSKSKKPPDTSGLSVPPKRRKMA